jgi:hypothetical protein
MKHTAGLCFVLAALISPAIAADFEIGPSGGGSESLSNDRSERGGLPPSSLPLRLESGDVPTAYVLGKYGLRLDTKFHDGGGILGKVYLGLFSRFTLGGAVEVRHFIGSGDLSLRRDDAQLLARLLVLREDDALPALAIGWDGPAYERGEAKGLYVGVSKEFPTALAFIQIHGGVNSANVEQFVATRDLRAFFALSTAFYNVGLFTEIDEVLNSQGSRWNAGFNLHFEPVTLGLEFRDLASPRPNTQASRLLRVSWNGRF